MTGASGAVPGRRLDRRFTVGAIAGLAGLILVVTGTFLPWLASGPVLRNSYQVTGVAARLAIGGDGPLTAGLRLWPLVGPLYFLPALLALSPWRRTAGLLAALLGLLAVGFGVATVAVAGGRSAAGITLVATGPVVLAVGGLLYATAGLIVGLRPRRGPAARRGNPDAAARVEPATGVTPSAPADGRAGEISQ